ncbi:ThiF family adenylyltransferase [Pedobacter suwonensis]|uniref:ThiF family adenylyltransferase n=1 Tax=Pedobacter suwonensis TaxID=332999 RepID=UPI0036967A7E
MQHQLISLSPDLKQIRDEGYEIEINGGYVCIHHIPYLNSEREIKHGKLVCALNLATPTLAGSPNDHTMYFCGEQPCHFTGQPMSEIINSMQNAPLVNGLIGNYYLSSKPASGKYANYYDKIVRYASLISVAAKAADPSATARTYKPMEDDEKEGVFMYYDTNSSRANILQLTEKFKGLKIGIIGLGGTGSYVLDFVAKTPVQEIHLFDGDEFNVHNSFRAPGATSIIDLEMRKAKVDYFFEIYSKMHKRIVPHHSYITSASVQLLQNLDYVFICVDKNSVRREIIDLLLPLGISFIDTGMGVTLVDGELTALLRTTTGTTEKNDHLSERIPTGDVEDNEYDENIQIAELNAQNAIFAILKWKKLIGFYQDRRREHHSSFTLNVGEILNGDTQS